MIQAGTVDVHIHSTICFSNLKNTSIIIRIRADVIRVWSSEIFSARKRQKKKLNSTVRYMITHYVYNVENA